MQKLKGIDYTSAIFKTNPRLTGNVKFVVDGNNINMTQLNDYNKEQSNLPYSNTLNFATNVSNFLQSYVANDKFFADNFNLDSNNVLKTKTIDQFDYQYQYGAKYGNEFGKHRFFAPLWITDRGCPSYFVIMARKKQTSQISRKTTLYDTMKFEIIKTIDIKNGPVGKMYNNITSFPMFRNEPLVFNTQNATIYGIDITKKAQSSTNKSTKQLQNTEYSILEADNYLTNIFMENKMIVQNLLNLEFTFELPEQNSVYEIVGYYVDDVNNVPINAQFNQGTYISNNGTVVNNTLTVTKKFNDSTKAFELEQFNVNGVYPTSYDVLLRRLSSPTVSLRAEVQNRFLQFEVRRAVATGDYFTIIEDGREHTVWCDLNDNSGHFFKYSANIATQMENLNDAIQRLDTKYLYIAKFNTKRSIIVIECMNYEKADTTQIFADVPDGFYPLITATTVPNNMAIKYRYEFSAFSTIRNTLVINNINTSLSGINLSEVSYTVLKMDGTEKRMVIKNILFDYDNNRVVIIFTEEFEFGDTLKTSILLSLFKTMNIEICQLQFYDILHFDYSMKSFEVPSKHNATKIVSSLDTNFPEIVDAVKSQFPEGSDLPFIESIEPNRLTYTNNPYKRLMEYDLQSLALFNKINVATNKWVSSKGLNCFGQPISANVSLSYNQANLSPVFDSQNFHDIQSLQYDYFVIGVKPSDSELSDFTSETVTMDKLNEPDALKKYFVHKVDKTINEMKFSDDVENYTKIFSKKDIVDKVFAIFKGVEYEFPVQFAEFNFTVVHVASADSLTPKISEVIDYVYKSFIIAIEFPITDTILTGVENEPELFRSPELKMHRYIYYSNTNDINTAGKIETSDISADILINTVQIGKKTQRLFRNTNVNDFKATLSGNLFFAIDMSSPQNLMDIFKNNSNAFFDNGQGYTVNFENIVDIQDNYIWVENVTDSDGFDLITEYLSSGDFLGVNQKVLIVMSKMAGITLKSKNYDTTAKRYYPISFTRFVRQLQNLKDLHTYVSKSKNATVLNYLTNEVNGLSHSLKSKDFVTSYLIQRYALNAVPLCKIALTPLSMVSYVEQEKKIEYKLKTFKRITLPKVSETLSDFGIFKVGDANTLTTDDIGNGDLPIHTQIGEVIYDQIIYPADFSPYVDKMRFYNHRNTFSRIKNEDVMVNHSGIISTFFGIDGKRSFESRFFGVSEFKLNVFETISGQVKGTFAIFNTKAVENFVSYILSKYHYTVKFYDFDGDAIQPILDADYLQSNIYESHYTLQNPSNVIAVIEFV